MLKTILIIQDFAYINGGNAKVALTSAIALKREGYRVVVFAGMGPVSADLKEAGIEVVCLNQKDILHTGKMKASIRGIWNIEAERKLDSLLSTIDKDETIVHLHGWNKVLSPSIWGPLRKREFKIVITMHDFFLFCPNLGLFNYPKLQICRKKPSSIGCYLCNCDSRSYLQKIWRDIRQFVQWYQIKRFGKFNVITIGKTNEKLSKKALGKHVTQWYNVTNPIDLNNNDIVDITSNDTYVFVGRLSPEKGIDLFCKCMTDLHLKGCVMGDGYLLDEYKQKYPNIEFTDWVSGESREQYIRKAKALIFPSLWYEGAPLTPVEMKSYGIPCIVPDQCAAAEVIIDGVDGYVFRIGDINSLKDAVQKYEATDLKIMQKNLIDSFNPADYSMNAHVQNLIECYKDILNH